MVVTKADQTATKAVLNIIFGMTLPCSCRKTGILERLFGSWICIFHGVNAII